ncbi:MAG TPA: hypothetical protein VG370_28875 [Chloroflexota bacterium]|jgi:hypothetical protein|nr:hypothetical protein [Chloroflexota bacterium]
MTNQTSHPHGAEALPASLRDHGREHGRRYTDAQVRELGRLAHALGALEHAVCAVPEGGVLRTLAGRAVGQLFRNCRTEGAEVEADLLLQSGLRRIAERLAD